MTPQRSACLMLLVFTLLDVRPVRATVIVPATLEELAAEAVAILHGRVVDIQARWEANRRQIESLVSIAAADYLKGDFSPTFVVRVAGGEIGRYRSVTIGAPTFAVGDEVVLFVGASGPSYPYILGLNQGLFRVARSGAGAMVFPPPVLMPSGGSRLVRGDPRRRPMPLDQFMSEVRALVDRSPRAPGDGR